MSVQHIRNLSWLHWGCLLDVNLQIYHEPSALQEVNNIPKLPGTHCGHDVKGLAFGAFFECIIILHVKGEFKAAA